MSVETTTSNPSSQSTVSHIIIESVLTMVRGVGFAIISFTLFMLCPIGLYVSLSTTDTVPLWFLGMQMLMFLFMAQHGLPILWAEFKQTIF